MTPDRLRQIASVLEVALELEPPLRLTYLQSLGQEDPELQREVEEHLGEAAEGEATEVATTTASFSDQAPERLGPYRIVEWIGAGGMGSVYLGERSDDQFVRQVAIKLLRVPFPSAELIHRFRSERQILASFDHPNIARLLDGGSTPDGRPFLVIEHIEGPPLPSYCDEHQLGLRERIELFLQVCSAVQYAHGRLVVHRDLKPSNILVTRAGEPKLLDFGIAKLLAPDSFPLTVQATATGAGPLTPLYASPEQLRGETVTTASDVYSLGVLLYLLLTGAMPYKTANTPLAVLHAISSSDPPMPSKALATPGERLDQRPRILRRRLAGDLDSIVMKALQPDLDRRYQSAEQLEEDLRRHLDGVPVLARDGQALYRAGRFVSRNKEAVAGAVGFLGLTGAYAMTMARQAAITAKERNSALEARDEAEKARAAAEKARRAAEDSARSEAEVSKFLVGMFDNADPFRANQEYSVQQLVKNGAAKIRQEETLSDLTRWRLLLTLGEVETNLCEFEEAEKLLLAAVSTLEGLENIEGSEMIETLISLGRLYGRTGRAVEADTVLIRAEALARELTSRPDLLGICLNLRGSLLPRLGQLSKALGLVLEAQQLLLPDDKYYWFCRVNEALFTTLVGDNWQGSARAFDLICDLPTALPGSIAIKQVALGTLGDCLFDVGQAEDALELLKICLPIERKLWGKDHLRYLRGGGRKGSLPLDDPQI